ncbi:MAG: hypothetical protein ACYTEQ_01325 [Planctomycetota bacterium]
MDVRPEYDAAKEAAAEACRRAHHVLSTGGVGSTDAPPREETISRVIDEVQAAVGKLEAAIAQERQTDLDRFYPSGRDPHDL